MFELREAAPLLGLALRGATRSSDVRYLELIERGLSVRTLERLAAALAPDDVSFKYRIVPKATFARAHARRRLTSAQSVLVARLASVWAQALRLFRSEETAREFLFQAHPLLDDCRPVDLVLGNEIGAALVRGVLGRLEVGTAA